MIVFAVLTKHINNTLARLVSECPFIISKIALAHCGFNPNSYTRKINVSIHISNNDFRKSDEGIETALHCAVEQDSLSKTELLLKYKPDLTIKWRGMTPLELAIAYNARPEILELLSQDMSESKISKGIEKCSLVHEEEADAGDDA